MIDPELEEQMRMLEGLSLDMNDPSSTVAKGPSLAQPVAVETADTLLGNVPFGSVTTPNVGVAQPFVAENPTNLGVVTNSVVPPVAQTVVTPQVGAPSFVPQNTVVTQPAMTNPVVQQSVPAAKKPELDMNAAPVFVNLGESTYETKTDFLKLKENESTRVTLINYNAVSTHIHYRDGLGYFKCLSTYEPGQSWPSVRAICCQQPNPYDTTKLDKGKTKILLPVIEYPVNHTDGKTIIQGEPKLKVLQLSPQEYNVLFEIRAEYGEDTSTFDLSISRKKDTTGFLKYTLTPGLSWRSKFAAGVAAESAKLTNETYNVAIEECAKTLTPERIQQYFTEKAQQEALANQLANQQAPNMSDLGLN